MFPQFPLKTLLSVRGFVDVHVHLREPGFSYKEQILTGTRAAAHGGYTTVCSMPNLNPAPDTYEHLLQQLSLIDRDGQVRVLPYGCITLGQKGEGALVDFAALKPYVAGFSDDGRGVQDESTMREAMVHIAALGGILARALRAERSAARRLHPPPAPTLARTATAAS